MIRKLLLAGGATALLSSLALGVPLWSYARCGTSWLSETASDVVPLEWELKRARQMITDLKPEIERNAMQIAREKVDVGRIEGQLDETNERLAKTQSDIERLAADLRADHSTYTYAGKTYTSAQVKSDLENRFKRFKTRQETANKLEQMLTARQASLQAAEDRMDAMLSAKSQLEVEVENLQARLAALRVAQTASELQFDDSQLARTRALLDEISTRIDVEEETMSVDVEYFGEIDLEESNQENLLDEISSYFGRDAGLRTTEIAAIRLD